MTKILCALGILFSVTSFAGNKNNDHCSNPAGCGDDWGHVKASCIADGGLAVEVPSKCAAYSTAAITHDQITYAGYADGGSANSKCCIKCKTTLVPTGEAKCGTSSGSVWLPIAPPTGCCFKTTTNTATATVTTTSVSVAIRRPCIPGYPVTTADINPVPANAAACTAAGYYWPINSPVCCKH